MKLGFAVFYSTAVCGGLIVIVGGLRFADVVHGFSVCMQLYNATQTLRFRFSTILDTVLRLLAHFVAVLRFCYPKCPPLSGDVARALGITLQFTDSKRSPLNTVGKLDIFYVCPAPVCS